MGNSNSNSSPLQTCLNGVFEGVSNSVSYPSNILFQFDWVKPYNLNPPVTPAAVTRPHTSEQIAQIIQCAVDNNAKVQPRSGGHSYGNYGLCGENGAVVVDLVNFKQFSMDKDTWQATIGAGTLWVT